MLVPVLARQSIIALASLEDICLIGARSSMVGEACSSMSQKDLFP